MRTITLVMHLILSADGWDGGEMDFPMPQRGVRPSILPGRRPPGTSPNPVMWNRENADQVARALELKLKQNTQLSNATVESVFSKLSKEEKRMMLDAAIASLDQDTAKVVIAGGGDPGLVTYWNNAVTAGGPKALPRVSDQSARNLFTAMAKLNDSQRRGAMKEAILALSSAQLDGMAATLRVEFDGGTL
ncbi:MAG: hypothetical protein Q8L48_11705 [Archangium sp.]|nr:hypothetical protein [Archangium sp.]